MTISFDLDDTLIPGVKTFPVEKQSWLQKMLGIEPVRAGTIELMKLLKSEGTLYLYIHNFIQKSFLDTDDLQKPWNISSSGY
jgi:hypothetical protein